MPAAGGVGLNKERLAAEHLGLLDSAQSLVDPLDHHSRVVLLRPAEFTGLLANRPIEDCCDATQHQHGQERKKRLDGDEKTENDGYHHAFDSYDEYGKNN